MAPPADVATSYSAAPHQIAPHKDFAHEYEYKLQVRSSHYQSCNAMIIHKDPAKTAAA